jgi:methyltransferase-like protein/SAM-dependent methyltransferase
MLAATYINQHTHRADIAMSESTYDAIPYQSLPCPQTQPDRLAVLGRLLGLKPPTVETARVLELGCAAGGNLIPLAEHFPLARFVGIDLSARQIADGQATIQALGLVNIELRHADIASVDATLGTFDYVVAHGVYSWVPDHVQDHILKVCRQNLSADGIAYVSYNTLPGWSMRGMIRQMMVFHSRRFPDPVEQVRQARGILDFLAQSAPADNPYGTFLRSELESLKEASDYYIFHEHLEENNHPCLFADFAARAGRHGLRFLAEAELQTMLPTHFPTAIQDVLRRVSDDLIYLEQYMDFLRNRMFRQTLLVPADKQPVYDLRPTALAGLYIASSVRPENPNAVIHVEVPENFPADTGMTLHVSEPIAKAALFELADAWPRRTRFEDLCQRARARLGGAPAADDAEQIGMAILQFFTSGGPRALELSTTPLEVAGTVNARPMIAPLARRQADRGEQVTTRRHESYNPGDFERELLRQLDGTNDRGAILSGLMTGVRDGRLSVARDGQPVTDLKEAEPLVAQASDETLKKFIRYSLLIDRE